MREAIRHRGPDGSGAWVSADGRAGLAHVRLAIIDIATGEQPMTSESGCVITYNGEIYNYIELRERASPGLVSNEVGHGGDLAGVRTLGRRLC